MLFLMNIVSVERQALINNIKYYFWEMANLLISILADRILFVYKDEQEKYSNIISLHQ